MIRLRGLSSSVFSVSLRASCCVPSETSRCFALCLSAGFCCVPSETSRCFSLCLSAGFCCNLFETNCLLLFRSLPQFLLNRPLPLLLLFLFLYPPLPPRSDLPFRLLNLRLLLPR